VSGPGPGRRPLLAVLRGLGLGDLLVAVPALRALADAFPGHRRVLLAPRGLAGLALAMGTVHEVVDYRAPLTGPGLFPPVPEAVAAPDVAVNLHGRGPQSHLALLATRPGRLVAFAHPDVPASSSGPPWDAGPEHERRRWCRLLAVSGVPADPDRLTLTPPRRRLPPGVRGATLVHPGAASPARRWPAERFASVARAERARGRQVVVTGGPDEVALAGEVARLAGLPPAAVHAGRTDLLQLAAMVAAAGRVVCGDTGVAHLAVAFGTPSVVLYGPVPPSRWGPPSGRPQHLALWAGRTSDPHATSLAPGLAAIRPADVLAALERLDRIGPSAAG
jgi:ADP-heptose:LPS heptosyltransferase